MLAGQLPKGVTGGQVRVKLGDGGAEYVFTGKGDYPAPIVGALHASICFVGAQPGDFATAVLKAKAFAAIDPVAETDKGVVYAFTESPGGHKSIDLKDQAAAAAALKSPATTVMIVQSTKHSGAQLGYAVPTL